MLGPQVLLQNSSVPKISALHFCFVQHAKNPLPPFFKFIWFPHAVPIISISISNTLLRHFWEHLFLLNNNSTLRTVILLFRSSLVRPLGCCPTSRLLDIEYRRRGNGVGSSSCIGQLKSGIGEELLPTIFSKAIVLWVLAVVGIPLPILSFENSKTCAVSTTLFIAYRWVPLNRRCCHLMVYCRHSPNVSLKISFTYVVGLYTAVMSTPISVGCILFPSNRSPHSHLLCRE